MTRQGSIWLDKAAAYRRPGRKWVDSPSTRSDPTSPAGTRLRCSGSASGGMEGRATRGNEGSQPRPAAHKRGNSGYYLRSSDIGVSGRTNHQSQVHFFRKTCLEEDLADQWHMAHGDVPQDESKMRTREGMAPQRPYVLVRLCTFRQAV